MSAQTTEMTNPPKQQTQMVQEKKNSTVRVVALQPFKIEEYVKDEKGAIIEDKSRMVEPGEIAEVSKARARELTKKLTGHYAFAGERQGADETPRHDFTRARLATAKDIEEAALKAKGINPEKPVDALDDLED